MQRMWIQVSIDGRKNNHGSNSPKECLYCRTTFLSQEKFREHMTVRHGMPDFTTKGYNGPHPVQSSIRGNLKIVQIPANGDEVHLLDYLNNRKAEIHSIVDVQTKANPIKIGLSASIQMIKDVHTDGAGDGEEKKIEFWANSQMKLLYPGNGLPDDQYWEAVEKILNSVSAFTSQGSGWRFEKLLKFELKLARFVPIRAGSYIALPPKFESDQLLLNIRNYNDANSFKYYYTAAFHIFNGRPLAGPETSWRVRKSPDLYGENNPDAHQPVGNFEMPMAVSEIGIFEEENDVQINIFR